MKNYSLISKNVFILPEGNPIKLVEYMIIRDDRQSKYYTILNIDNQTANILQKIVIKYILLIQKKVLF